MNKYTLEHLLKGQDLNPSIIVEKVLNDKPVDTITKIIVDAWESNGGPSGEFDLECYKIDLQYAVNQINKAILIVS